MTSPFGSQSMAAPLRRVIVKRPEEAFRGEDDIAAQWQPLGYTAPPDLDRAAEEHRRFVALLEEVGAEVLYLPADDRTGLDSLYTHDPALVTDSGVVIFQTGKPARRGEGPALADALKAWGVPVLGVVDGAATAEGGDMVWLDRHTLVVGRGYRTNAAGVAAVRSLVAPLGVEVIQVHLPYWNGPDEVLHLMSFISLLDDPSTPNGSHGDSDRHSGQALAVVYRRLMPVPLVELLDERGVELVDIPDEEFPTQGCNVLALAPRHVVMLRGNPVTRARLAAAGCTVHEFDGNEIAFKGMGGPTCLTRPLWRGN